MSDKWNSTPFGAGLLVKDNCRDETAQVAVLSYIDGEADSTERLLAEDHLSKCRACLIKVSSWRHEAKLLKNQVITGRVSFQIQNEVRGRLKPVIHSRTSVNTTIFHFKFIPIGLASLIALAATFALVARPGQGVLTLLSPDIVPFTENAANKAEFQTAGTLNINRTLITPAVTPTTMALPVLPPNFQNALKAANLVRFYPASQGRFSGTIAVIAWFKDGENRLWIIDPVRGESEISLKTFSGGAEPVKFSFEDPQTVMWSERGAIITYQLGNAGMDEWGLVVPQTGQIQAARLVQPNTATALAVVTISPLPHS